MLFLTGISAIADNPGHPCAQLVKVGLLRFFGGIKQGAQVGNLLPQLAHFWRGRSAGRWQALHHKLQQMGNALDGAGLAFQYLQCG